MKVHMTREIVCRGSVLAAITGAIMLSPGDGHAQTWPTKPVRVISPIGAGSAADILSRTFSEQLSTRLGSRSSSRTGPAPAAPSVPTWSRRHRPTVTRS